MDWIESPDLDIQNPLSASAADSSMGKALCCGEQPVLIAFTKIVLLAPELCGEFSHHLRA